MTQRISPAWWPILATTSPAWIPWLVARSRRFRLDRERASQQNQSRIASAGRLDLPEVAALEIHILSEWRSPAMFRGEAGVSYLVRTDSGSLLYDVAFGDQSGAVEHNARELGVTEADVEAVAISHLHNDHMGGTRAFRSRIVDVPAALRPAAPAPCFLPDKARVDGFRAQIVDRPRLLHAGIATTGPLARRLFFLGWVEEQTLVVRLRDKGLVVLIGCGHPTLPTILEMVARISPAPIHAIVGGLHLPLTGGRIGPPGIDLQTLAGTGKPPWQRITEDDVEAAAAAIRSANPKRLLLSAHDSCDAALARLVERAPAEAEVLEAGGVYRL